MNFLITILLAGIAFSSMFPEYLAAAEISVCIKKNGTLRVANNCKQNESHETLSGSQGPKGETGPQGPKGDPGAGGIKVFDANGQFLGYHTTSTVVYVPSINAEVTFDSSPVPGNFGQILKWEESRVSLLYTTLDCSGTPFYPAGGQAYPQAYLRNGKVYVVKEKPPIGTQKIQSSIYQGSCAGTGSYESIVSPGFDFTEVTLPFTLPIAFPLRFE